jgi:hypothetical protein
MLLPAIKASWETHWFQVEYQPYSALHTIQYFFNGTYARARTQRTLRKMQVVAVQLKPLYPLCSQYATADTL